MLAVVVDTGVWLGALSRRDSRHQWAASALDRALREGWRLYAHSGTIVELELLLAGRIGRPDLSRLLFKEIVLPGVVRVEWDLRTYLPEAMELRARFGASIDHDLVDALNLAVFRRLKCDHILTVDARHHLDVFGLTLPPGVARPPG